MNEKRTLLIVDDQEINRRMLGSILKNDYELVFAENGAQALAVLRDERQFITAVLLDIVMPVLDGYGVLKAMGEDPRLAGIPVLVTTQKESEGEELHAFHMGAYDFISKPYHPEIIRHRIAKTIQLMESDDLLRRAERRAQTDSLTGLYNRAAFENAVSEYLASTPQGQAALLMLDLDSFKTVNDLYGHAEGDRVLREVGATLKTCFRTEDVIARLGGDEFGVFLPSLSSVELLTERLEAVCGKIAAMDLKQRISCSIGACQTPEHGSEYQELYQHADMAMLAAKRLGKNQFHIYGGKTELAAPLQLRSMEWLLDEIEEAVLITDRQSREILYLNRPAAAIGGKEKRDCIGKRCYRVIWGRSAPCALCGSSEQVGSGFHEYQGFAEGQGKLYHVITKMIEWDERPARLQFIRDFTEANLMQKRTRRALSALQVGFAKCDAGSGRVLNANDAFYQMTGYTRGEFKTACPGGLSDIFSPEDAARLRGGCAEPRAERAPFALAAEFIQKGGERLPVIVDGILMEENGRLFCYQTYTDVGRVEALRKSARP